MFSCREGRGRGRVGEPLKIHITKSMQKSRYRTRSSRSKAEATLTKTPWDMRTKPSEEPDSEGNPSTSGWLRTVGLGIITLLRLYSIKSNSVVKGCSVWAYREYESWDEHKNLYDNSSSSTAQVCSIQFR